MSEEKLMPYQIPSKYRKVIAKGDYAVFKMLGTGMVDGKFSGYTCGIPVTDTILDDDGNVFHIGYVSGYRAGGEPIFGDISFSIDNQCMIILHHGVKDAAKFDFMKNSNYNKSNPNRDPAIHPTFEEVTSTTNARDSRVERANRVKAMDIARSFSNEEIVAFVRANAGLQDSRLSQGSLPNGDIDYDEVRESVEAFAERKTAVFLSLNDKPVESESVDAYSELIKSAEVNKVIAFDKDTKQWFNSTTGKPFLKVLSIKNGTPQKELLAWLKTPAGASVLEKLEG